MDDILYVAVLLLMLIETGWDGMEDDDDDGDNVLLTMNEDVVECCGCC